ncbi:MAG TPA: penicillin acylase family protein [Nitriliruptorales bacterium]
MSLARRAVRRLLGERLPVVDGVLTSPAVGGEVTIRRDEWSIPHVRAADEADAMFGFGFAMGQDRAFQVEALARVGRGRLSELVGSRGLAIDRLTRRLGIGRVARAQVGALDDRTRRLLDAFAAGITAGATDGCPEVPHEYALLRTRPHHHTTVDVVATYTLQAFLLAANWETELGRLKVLTEDGDQALRALDPIYRDDLPVTAPPGGRSGAGLVDRLGEDLARLTRALGSGASNNWVLDGSRTATGRPLVANDPHLPGVLPALWYLAHVSCDAWSVAGAALAGTPGFGAAHNGFGAWGATSGHTDNTDLFLEELGPDGRSVREGEQFVPCEVLRETIRVRFGRDVVEEIVITPRGPIVGPAIAGTRDALSIRGVWQDVSFGPGVLDLVSARSFGDLRKALEGAPAMQLNVVWGDEDGHIGWQLAGLVPRRTSGWGLVPAPGWEPDVGWEDEHVPFEALPFAHDPAAGWLATANNQPAADVHLEAFLGSDFLDGYRLAAIVEVLQERDDWDVAATLVAQTDVRSTVWPEVRDTLLKVDPHDPGVRVALDLLRGWDGRLAPDSRPASVFALAMAELAVRVVRAKAPTSGDWFVGRSFSPISPHSLLALRRTAHVVQLLREQPDGWFMHGWHVEIADVLRTVVGRLRSSHDGQVPAWGEIRPLYLRHLLSDGVPGWGRIFDRGPIRIGGDAHTIPQASVPPLDPTGTPIAIASARMVVDVGDWEASRFVLAGGQSGNPCSPHYDDQLSRWERGEAVPIAWSDAAVAGSTRHTLRVLPAWEPAPNRKPSA